jgi:hypothetical protein
MSIPARPILALLSLAALAGSTASQEVSFRGKIEDGEDICYYCPGFGFVVNGSNTTLSSSAYNLNPLIGSHVRATGTWNGSTSSPNIHITWLEVTPESFTLGGGGQLGSELDFTAFSMPGDTAVVAGSFGAASFTVLPGSGVAFLDWNGLFVVGSGVMGSNGELSRKVAIPNIPSLQGLKVFGQGMVFPSAGTPFVTSPDWKTLGV